MKTLEEGREDNIWLEYYINLTKINQRFVNSIVNEDFNPTQMDHNYQSVANQYIFSKALGQYCSQLMHKQKNTQRILIYYKWEIFLPNIRCKNEVANILLLSTLFLMKKI